MLFAIIGLVSITLIGFIAHRIGICLVRGVRLGLEKKDYSLLAAILMSGLWVGAYSVFTSINDGMFEFPRFNIHPLFALGGFVFGIGASINQGCSVSTVHQFARGNLSMIFTMAGWFLGWLLWRQFAGSGLVILEYRSLPSLDLEINISLFAVCVAITLFMIFRYPAQRERWIGVSLIGLLTGVLFFIEPLWAPTRFIQDVGGSLVDNSQSPSNYRTILVALLLIGMWVSVLVVRDIKFRLPTLHKIARHSIAGVLMGIGGAMALGGNDAQILMGLPSLSLGAIMTLVFMLVGIATEQWLYHSGKLFYEKR